MNLFWTNLRITVDEDEKNLPLIMAHKLKIAPGSIRDLRVLRRSLDARKKPNLFFSYTLSFVLNLAGKDINRILQRVADVRVAPVEKPRLLPKPQSKLKQRPVVVGSGPAGYFAALALARQGYAPLVLERGDDVEERTRKVEAFWQTGRLDGESNVQFGEGGAGTFSDGKLTTRISDGRIADVLKTFVAHGAPPEILFLAKPHIGTDILKGVVREIRREIEALGGEVRFRSKVTGLRHSERQLRGLVVNGQEEIPAEAVILAIGHSSRDTYRWLLEAGVHLEQKPFAMGLRVEHPQEVINLSQYGVEEHPKLGPADYQLTYQDSPTGRGAFAFCMCPGGRVVAAASEERRVVTNGMSEYSRDTGVANSALVVTVGPEDFLGKDPLAGMSFQQQWEHQAYLAGGGSFRAPAQSVRDFLARRVRENFPLVPSYTPGVVAADLHEVLPKPLGQVLERALASFEGKIKGFAGERAVLTGIESRTSAPVRILRGESGEARDFPGIYPAGEGAGYAGGIMSAAVDGIRAAERLSAVYGPAD